MNPSAEPFGKGAPKSLHSQMPTRISLCYATDTRYIPHLATSLVSLLANGGLNFSRIYVIASGGISEDFDKLSEFFAEIYGLEITLLELVDAEVSGLQVTGHISLAAYSRLLIAELLPLEEDIVLYLDCDTLVVSSIQDLREQAESLKASKNELLRAVDLDDSRHLVQFGHSGETYFNSGVMLISLDRWRARNVGPRLVEVGRRLSGRLQMWDQDVLNIVLEDSWGGLPLEYNEVCKQERVINAKIVHFVGATKPWMVGGFHPYRKDYVAFRKLTPFVPFRPEGRWAYLVRTFVPRFIRRPRKTVARVIKRLTKRIRRVIAD